MIESISWFGLAVALLGGYVIGSLPVAYVVGRTRGVNIFEVGTGQAGATNVWREVSPRLGWLVFWIDAVKGLGAIYLGRLMGLEASWLLLPALAVIVGHWSSLFTGFRGGDGVSTFAGVGLGLLGWTIVLPGAVILIIAVGFNSRLAHPSLWGAVVGYIVFLFVAHTEAFAQDRTMILGITGLMTSILLHSVVYYRKVKARREAAALMAQQAGSTVEERSPRNA